MNTFLEAIRLNTVLRLIANAVEQRQMLGKVAVNFSPSSSLYLLSKLFALISL